MIAFGLRRAPTFIGSRCSSASLSAPTSQLGFVSIVPIPISARYGDNTLEHSGNTPWYRGPTSLEHLETIDVNTDELAKPFRFQVQWVNRPNLDFRGYAGTVAARLVASFPR